jgi:hypothetical protein
MASSFSTNIHLEKPANGDDVNTWDVPVNADWDAIDAVFGNTTSINVVSASGIVTLTLTQYRPRIIIMSGLLTAAVNYQLPTGIGGTWSIFNNTTGAYSITFSSAGGGTTVTLLQGFSTIAYCDGTNVALSYSAIPASGSNTQVQYNSSGFFAGSANLTFNASTGVLSAFAFSSNATSSLNPASSLLTIENLNGNAAQFAYTGSNNLVTAVAIRLNSTSPTYLEFFSNTNNAGSIVPNGANAITVNTTSDARRKTVGSPYDPGDVFDKIELWNFTWDTGEHGIGPMAQDLLSVAPKLVRQGDDDLSKRPGDDGFQPWSTALTEPLTMAFAEIKALRARLSVLEGAKNPVATPI